MAEPPKPSRSVDPTRGPGQQQAEPGDGSADDGQVPDVGEPQPDSNNGAMPHENKDVADDDPYAAMCGAVWGPKPIYQVDTAGPEVPIDASRFEQIMVLNRAPLVRRLLIGLHYMACVLGTTRFTVPESTLASWLWPGPARPANWHRSLYDVLVQLESVADAPSLAIRRGLCFNVPPAFFGSLAALLQPNQDVFDLVLTSRNPKPEWPVSAKQLQYLRDHGWPAKEPGNVGGGGYSNKELRDVIRRYRQEAANTPTLGKIAKTQAYRNIFIPALLGHEHLCRSLGSLVNLLVDHHTRWHHDVIDSKIASGGKSGKKVKCDWLKAEERYATFAGNSGGRGYKAAVWAKYLNTDEVKFLKRLAVAQELLQLVVIGVDKTERFYTLAELLDSPLSREKANIRIYTGRDYRYRWAKLFGWEGATAPPTPATPEATKLPDAVDTDRGILRERVMLAGLRTVAEYAKVAPGHLSLFLNHGRGLSVQAINRVRRVALGRTVLTPKNAAAALTKCQTLKDWAVGYASLGLSIVPLKPGTRAGYIKWAQFQRELPLPDQVAAWWDDHPDAAIGCILGPISGLLAIDTDDPIVVPTAKKLLGPLFTRCPAVVSGSHKPGHGHYLMQHPAGLPTSPSNVDAHVSAKLEIRGHGGLLILPPSQHKSSGKQYEWVPGRGLADVPLPKAPPKVIAILKAANAKRTTKVRPANIPSVRQAGDGDFSTYFAKYKGVNLPKAVAEFLRGTYAHTGGWNRRIFEASRWCRDHRVPQDQAERVLVAGADPDNDTETANALATIRSAYSYRG